MVKKLKKAFTITELVIVIAVIGILVAVLIPTFSNVVENAHKSTALQTSNNALKEYLAVVMSDDNPDNDNPLGMVFVHDGYAHVYLNNSLHYLGKTGDMAKLGISTSGGTTKVGIDGEPPSQIQMGTIADGTDVSTNIGLSFTAGEANAPSVNVYFSEQGGVYGLAAVTDKKAAEQVYFYQIAINGTTYYGYFTLENENSAFYVLEDTVYSRIAGFSAASVTVAFVPDGGAGGEA